MQPVSSFKYFGLVAAVILLCGLVFVIRTWPQGRHKTFSQHVAVYPQAIRYYILLFSLVLPLLILFFVQWFTPVFQLSGWFNALIITSSLFQYACTLVPEIGGWKTKLHLLFAGLSAICLVPALWLLSVSELVSAWGKAIALIGLAAMAAVIIALAVCRGRQTHALMLQAGYFAAFFVPVLAVSYL